MLYDPSWNKPADLTFSGVSLRKLVAWLETKPAGEGYDFMNPYQCATGQFLYSQGLRDEDVLVDFTIPTGLEYLPESEWLRNIVETEPRTFGAALQRARETVRQHSPHMRSDER